MIESDNIFSPLSSDDASDLLTMTTDVAIVMDPSGKIEGVRLGNDSENLQFGSSWIGKSWVDTVTVESRPKVEALLEQANKPPTKKSDKPMWRHINHPAEDGPDIPLLYSAVASRENSRVIAVGRDLSSTAELQRRLIDAQLAMERDYAELRQAENRYRALFNSTTDAVLILDGNSNSVVEANAIAAQLFSMDVERVIGRKFPAAFEIEDSEPLVDFLIKAKRNTDPRPLAIKLLYDPKPLNLTVSVLRQDSRDFLIVRISHLGVTGNQADKSSRENILDAIDELPDGIVMIDSASKIIATNSSFLNMIQASDDVLVRNEALEQWIGKPGIDLPVMLAKVREQGSLRLFKTILRDSNNAVSNVEISAVLVPRSGEKESVFALAIRNIDRRLQSEPQSLGGILPRGNDADQISELVGRVPLKDLVREATDLVECLCIEAALRLTENNRVSAAEVLGLSRQSLYSKMHRHGLGDINKESSRESGH